MRSPTIVLGLLAALATVPPGPAVDWTVLGPMTTRVAHAQDFEWTGRVPSGGVIEVKGISGRVRAMSSRGSEVRVTAVKHGPRRDLDEVTFDVLEHRDGVTICAIYPTRRRSRPMDCEEGGWHDVRLQDIDVEVDFAVQVPAGVRFVGRTISGDVEAVGLEAEVTARTVSGDIDISTRDVARASTVSGSIRASLGRADWRGELEFTTVSGDIVVDMPDPLDADVEFSAVSGEMSSDFAISMRGRSFRSTNLRGTIGRGGRTLVLKTVSGDVSLRRGS